MNCTSCGEENRESAKFCAECGTPVVQACANCDHPLSPTAKFCDECGTAVVAPAVVDDAPKDDGAVRRTVTIMFADLVGSTAFGEAVDAESARREMGAYHELAQSVIEAFGGEVIKFIGDGVMAGFGVVEVAEDDADRAVRAGIELQRAMVDIVDGVRDRHGAEVGLRIGINTGEVVIAADDADMIGDAINTAARIEAQCTPGRVLVGEQTWRLTRATVDYEVLGEVEVKGKAEPIATFQVLAAVEDEEVATPFVGRADELANLTASLENTIADGAPQLVTVIGSPGVGKTRLAAEMARQASEVTSFDLRVDRAGAATFEPVAELLRTVSELPAGLSPDDTAVHLTDFVGETDDRERLVPLLSGFVGAAPLRSTEESFWAARRLVEIVVAERPAVIVIDDIQWAEPLFLDLLEHLVEWTEGAAFLVALARPEIREIRPAFAEVGRRVSEVIALEGLDPATMAELATGILGGKSLPDELVRRLPDSTEGNPLFVRELVRMLVDDGVITETPTGWTLAIDADAVEVPPTILSLLASRVERMDDEERRVVEAAAVVGSEFPRGAVGTLLPNLGAAQLDRLLERLRRQEIIDPTGTYWGDEPIWRFHHVLIRDAAYRRLLKERRIEMHRRVGQWTETTAVTLGGEHEISIAFHYEQSHGYQRELGPLDDTAAELGGRAADLLTVAAERALARDDLAAAGALASRALVILEPDDHRRPELLLAACEAWFGAGRVHDAARWLEELRTHTGDDRIEAWTAAFEGQHVVLTDPDRLHEVEPLVADAAEGLAAIGDDSGVAKARLVRALVLARTGRVGQCEEELDAALAAARAADDRRRTTAVLGAAPLAALWGPSPVARAGGRCLDIIRLLRITSASPMVEAVSIRCQAVLEAMRGRFDEARTLIGRSQAIVEELGLRHGILECRMFAGYIELLANDPAAAEPHLRVAHAGLGTLGVGADAGQASALLSRALLRQGRVEQAAELADESSHLAGQNLQTSIASRAAQAEIAAQRGHIDDALELAQAAVAIGAETDLTMDHANALMSLAEVHFLRGDQQSAMASTRQAHDLFATKGAIVAEDAAVRERFDFRSMSIDTPCTRYARAASEALYDRKDVAAWEALCRPDAMFYDHRSLHDDVADLAGRRTLQHELIQGLSSYDTRFVASRGQRLCVFANTIRFENDRAEISILNVLEVDEAGLLMGSAIFDADDIGGAMGELTERYATGEASEYADVLRTAWRQFASMADGEAMGEEMADDYVFVDHRRMMNTAGDLESVRQLTADVDLTTLFARSIERLNRHGLVGVFHTHSSDDAALDAEWGTAAVLYVRDGKIWRSEMYDGEDLHSAVRQFDQLTNAVDLENEATRVGRLFWSRMFDELDVEHAMELMGGATFADERFFPLPELESQQLAAYLATGLDGVTAATHEFTTIATRGDFLAMHRLWNRRQPAAVEGEFFGVIRVADGLLIETRVLDNVEDAYAEMECQFREHEGAEYAEVLDLLSELQHARATGDRETADRLLHPGGRLIDHRAGQQMDGEFGQVQPHANTSERTGTIRTTQLHRLTTEGWVASITTNLTDPNGFAVQWRTCAVNLVEGGQVTHWEVYEEQDVEAACARFDELTAPSSTLDNEVVRLSRQFWSLLFDDLDVEGAMEYAAGEISDDRSLQLPSLERSRLRQFFEESLVGVTSTDYEFTPNAVWGEHHSASRVWVRYHPSEVEKEIFLTGRSEGGRVADAHIFETLDEAYAELERSFREHEGADFAEVLDSVSAQVKALAELDLDKTWELAHRDCMVVDHRPLISHETPLADMLEPLMEIGMRGSTIIERFVRLTANGAVHVDHSDFTDKDGVPLEFRTCQLRIVRDGKCAHFEIFDEHDVDAACARFDELTKRAGLNNAASELARRFYQKLLAGTDGEITDLLALLRPDWTMADERTGGVVDLDASTAAAWFRQQAGGASEIDVEVLAVRGERAAVLAVNARSDGVERPYLGVVEVDAARRGRRMTLFDHADLRLALDLLTEWYVEGEGAPYRAVIEGGVRLAESGRLPQDERIAVLAEILHDDFMLVDHRPFNLPDIDRASILVMEEEEEARFSFAPAFLRLAPNALLAISEDRTTNPSGGEVLHHHHTVQAHRDGRIANLEFFAEDQLAEAEARFAELAAAPRRTERTTAERTADEMFSAFMDRDVDGFAAYLADDFIVNSERSLLPGEMTREFFLEALASHGGFYPSASEGTVATCGDLHAVTTVTQVSPEGFETEFLLALEFRDDGLLHKLTSFDGGAEGEQAATDLIESWSLEHAPTQTDPASEYRTTAERLNLHLTAAAARGDWDTVRAMLAADFTFASLLGVTGFGAVQSADDYIVTLQSFSDQGTDLSLDVLATRGDHFALSRLTADRGGFTSETYLVNEADRDGRILRGKAYEEHDLEAARAELQEWWLESLDGDTAGGLALLPEWTSAASDRDADRLRSILGDDMVALDHRPVSWGSGDRQWFIDVQMEFYAAPLTVSLLHAPIATPRGGVIATMISSPDGSREWHDAIVYGVERGQLSRLEFYPGDRLGSAVARFHELTAEPSRGNRASEVDLVFRAAVGDRDMAALAELVAADAVIVDHRKLTARPIDTMEGIVDSVHAFTDQSMSHSFDLITSFGETVAFVEVTIASDTGFDVQLFTVTEIDDEGRVCRFETFDAEGFQAAQRCAIDCWFATEAPAARPVLEPLMDLSDAFAESDFEAIGALLSPDFRHTVTKPLTAEGEFDATGFMENMKIWVDMSGAIKNVTRDVIKWSHRGAVLISEIHATDSTGMVTEWASAHVFIVVDGKITRWEEFETHAIDAAVARFDELMAPASAVSLPPLWNEASNLITRSDEFVYTFDFDAVRRLHAANHVFEDRRSLVAIPDIEAGFATQEREQNPGVETRAIAVRGERVAIVQQRVIAAADAWQEFDNTFLRVTAINADGKGTADILFDLDDLPAALAEANARHIADEGAGHVEMLELAARWEGRFDFAEMANDLADDFEFVNHDIFETLSGDGERLLSGLSAAQEIQGSTINFNEQILRLTDAGMVVLRNQRTTTDDGFDAEWQRIAVSIVDDGKLQRTELFKPDQLAEALARLDELTAGDD